jgi:hypothetical protein
VNLEQLAALDEVADRHRLDAQGLRLATAASWVPIALEIDRRSGTAGTPMFHDG